MSGKSKKLTRRKFIDLGIQGYAGLQLASLAPGTLLSLSGCTLGEAKTFHGVCYHDCPDSCSWKVTVKHGVITAFAADKNNPFTAGKLCGKMETFPQDIAFHPDRIVTPLKRVGEKGQGKFEEISWMQAIREVAEKLTASVEEYGSESVLPFGYMGTQSLIQKSAMSKRFFTKLGASNLSETICGAPAVTGNLLANGQTTGVLPEDIVNSRYIILWGTNTKKSNIHLWPFILKAREQGAKLVVIDPFKSVTAMEADLHIQPMPDTDVALALGMMHIIINEGLTDNDYIERYTLGFEALKAHVQNYDPASVAAICGLEESQIIDLAHEYAKAKPSLIRYLIGMEHSHNGGDAFRAIGMLPSLTGAWREHGGGLMHFTYELFGKALNWERLDMHSTLAEKETRFINMVQLGRVLNNRRLRPAIKTLFVFNANPVVSIPNQNLIRKGLEREDLFTVVVEHFITDTAKYADYIFPATTQLEHWDIADSWGQVYINLNQPAIEPIGEAKPNSEFFRLLAKEMGFTDPCFEESDLDLVKSVVDSDHPYLEGITFDYLMEHGWAKLKIPEPFMPHAQGGFGTESGKCEFYATSLKNNGHALPKYRAVRYRNSRDYPLQLMTVKATKNFHNSSHANVRHLIETEGAPTLEIHSKDALSRNISNGDLIRVENRNGSVIIKARLKNRIRPGVVLMPSGFWPSHIKGSSTANALTNDRLTDLGGGAAIQNCRVQVIKYEPEASVSETTDTHVKYT
ncbi:molybdopterin-containing oxidoreductase family protein [Robertkochia solimangrovi]|uniref:molybdopterin-containing oxidoreductase family protein n=1 Tax=Robertkochia solimangrovi TaxID=2213046 RepID=UPI0011811ACB|nr:molybdopterin-dependent oxidoreductase [Robertkochia solimangrovi]TRZ46347.1 molybdopterin oxidoreductase family protein [Robertkochia solimangrovi]